MARTLTTRVVETTECVLFVIEGSIIEGANLDPLLLRARNRVVIDLSGVEHINSTGVARWSQFLAALCARTDVTLDKCSPIMVQQFNMIQATYTAATIRSILLPYYCEECDVSHQETLILSDAAAGVVADEVPCPECGANIEFEFVPNAYLRFHQPSFDTPHA